MSRMLNARHRQDEALRQSKFLTESLLRDRVMMCGESRAHTGIRDGGRRGRQFHMPCEVIEGGLRDGEETARLTTIEWQHQADVNVVPPGIVTWIDIPIAALKYEHTWNTCQKRKGEFRIEQ